MLTLIPATKLASIASTDTYRQRFCVSERDENHIVIQGKALINFTSNDYLAVTQDEQVKQAMYDAIHRYGMGSASSTLISGYFEPQFLLEQKFAHFFNREKALLFNSGFLANLGLMSTFANRSMVVFADKHCHASILQGIHLSRAKLLRYEHNDYQQLESFLQRHKRPSLITTEGVFSMDGSISDVRRLANIAKNYQSLLMLDDAHGAGVLGVDGKGSCEFYNLSPLDVPLLVIPLGKAFGGLGAVVLGQADNIELILQCAASYRYTTALPPHLAAGMLQALAIVEMQSWRRVKLQQNIQVFIKLSQKYNLPLMNDAITPIKAFFVGNNRLAVDLQLRLMQQGFFVSCIRPPTVPANTARLRISINCAHEEDHLQQLALCMSQLLCV